MCFNMFTMQTMCAKFKTTMSWPRMTYGWVRYVFKWNANLKSCSLTRCLHILLGLSFLTYSLEIWTSFSFSSKMCVVLMLRRFVGICCRGLTANFLKALPLRQITLLFETRCFTNPPDKTSALLTIFKRKTKSTEDCFTLVLIIFRNLLFGRFGYFDGRRNGFR